MAEVLKLLLEVKHKTLWDFWNIPFVFLEVKSCNAGTCHSFSQDILLDLEVSSEFVPVGNSYYGVPLCEIFMKSIFSVLFAAGEKYSDMTDSWQRKAVETLIQFLQNIGEGGNHLKCLRTLQNDSKLSEAQIQAVLACHLFTPLLAEGEVIVDNKCAKTDSIGSSTLQAQCPFCKQHFKEDNTNFGVKDLWHGRADIVVKTQESREVVTVTVDMVDEEEEDEGGHGDQSAAKKTKLDDCHSFCLAEVKSPFDNISNGTLSQFVNDKSYKQVISQTLVNAFLAVKYNKKLDNVLIPSFLVSQSSIYINFYNVNQDVLLVQSMPMKFFEGNVNYAAFFSVWMALNFDAFPSEMMAGFYSSAKKSGFKSFLEATGVLEKYQNEVEDHYTLTKKKPSVEQSRKYAIPQGTFDKLVEIFDEMRKAGMS